MASPLRIATNVLGTLFAVQAVAWIALPARAAQFLGMPLLDGLARSTQIGDFAAFFGTLATTILLGARPGRAKLLLVPAGMLAGVAAMRTLAWSLHGAAFATVFIGVEIASAVLLLVASWRLGSVTPGALDPKGR